jgi:high-affinity iron transporter
LVNQIVGVLPSPSLTGLPSLGFLGMYQTWETFAPQMAVLLYVLMELSFTEVRRVVIRRAAAREGAPNGSSVQRHRADLPR